MFPFVRRKRYEAERRARVRAEMVNERQTEEICALETGRSKLFQEINRLRDRLQECLDPKGSDDPPERLVYEFCYA